ncbi:MAG: sugar transferase [Rhodobacteraceae bacterium]|nr:sugar transferase [Paracoccaceae bacterium]
MTATKRAFDLIVSVILALLLWPVLIAVIVALLLLEGRPVFYIAERMRATDRSFQLIKFRTMAASAANTGVTGGDKNGRMSRFQLLLRRSRADELPQLWNVIRGDISLVGPRPPLRVYVEAYPEIYSQVLQSRPGITGLASLRFHAHEETILATCSSAAETDTAYRQRCIPRKAALDLLYQKNRTLCFDLKLIGETAVKPFLRRS